MAGMKCWGEYGPYEAQEDGLPNFGQVVSDFLKRDKWTVEQLGRFYGIAVKDKPYTRMRIYQMIRDNSFPQDTSRRYILAKLLSIPPVLLGVTALEDLLEDQAKPEIRKTQQKKGNIDLNEYAAFLKDCWARNRSTTAQDVLREISSRIDHLHGTILYVGKKQQGQMMRLLCQYHILLGQIARDQQYYNLAIIHLGKAATLAEEKKYDILYATALLQRGITLREKAAMSQEPLATQKTIQGALRDFTLAKKLLNSIDPLLQGAILLASGDIDAYIAYHQKDSRAVSKALVLSDRAQSITQQGLQESEHFIRFNTERFHLGKASTLIDIHAPDSAMEHLDYLEDHTPSGKRRGAYFHILYARAYMEKGLFPVATEQTREALTIVKGIKSEVNLARIAQIYEELRAGTFGNSIEVADLAVDLMLAQYPHIFSH